MREAGNDSYRKERHALKACDLYTEAIFLAPSQDSIAAAMAHANRSTVLHDCGMFEVRQCNIRNMQICTLNTHTCTIFFSHPCTDSITSICNTVQLVFE